MASRFAAPGLTLIELLVVLTLMAFVAATVTVKFSGRISSASLGQAVSVWKFSDTQLRQQTRRNGRRAALRIDVGTNQIKLVNDADDGKNAIQRTLGRGVEITRYRSATREVTYGPVEIEYSGEGTTETFVIEITGTSGKRWLLVAGVTGQTSELSNEQEVDAWLSSLLPASVHAG